jgi:hypothetical protein
MKIRRLTGTARAYATGQSQCLPQTKSDDTNGAIHPELTARLEHARLYPGLGDADYLGNSLNGFRSA